MRPGLLYLLGLWRASSDAMGRGRSFLLCAVGGNTMARRKTRKKSSNKLLKTAILLILFIGLWFIYQQPAVQKRINEVLHPRKPAPTAVQTVPEPEVPAPKPQQGNLPPPEPVVVPPSTKDVTYTVKNPQFDNLSYGVPGAADSGGLERTAAALRLPGTVIAGTAWRSGEILPPFCVFRVLSWRLVGRRDHTRRPGKAGDFSSREFALNLP